MVSPAALSAKSARYLSRQRTDDRRRRRGRVTGENIEPAKRAIAKVSKTDHLNNQARRRTMTRLVEMHFADYTDIMNEERAERGLCPICPRLHDTDPPELYAAKERARAISRAFMRAKRQCAHPRVVTRNGVRCCDTCGREM